MLPVIQIGPLAIQFPGLILLGGLWLGLAVSERMAKKFSVDANQLYNLVFLALMAGLAGARLAYVARYPSAFTANPSSLVSLNPGLLDPLGGLAAAVLASLIYGQRINLAFWPTLDTLTPTLATLAIASGLANLASGNSFGVPADLPWSIELWGAQRHPTQIYEAIAAGIIMILTWPGRQTDQPGKSGIYFLAFIALSALARLFIESFRADSVTLANGLRTTQVIAWLVLATSLFGLGHRVPARPARSEVALQSDN